MADSRYTGRNFSATEIVPKTPIDIQLYRIQKYTFSMEAIALSSWTTVSDAYLKIMLKWPLKNMRMLVNEAWEKLSSNGQSCVGHKLTRLDNIINLWMIALPRRIVIVAR